MAQRPPNRPQNQTPNRPHFRQRTGSGPVSAADLANTNKNFPRTNTVRSNQIVTIAVPTGSSGAASGGSISGLSGDVAGPANANQINSIMGVPLSGTLSDGQAYYQSGGVLTPVT